MLSGTVNKKFRHWEVDKTRLQDGGEFPGVLLTYTQPLSLSHARMSPGKIKNSLRLLTDPYSLLIRMKCLRMFQKER